MEYSEREREFITRVCSEGPVSHPESCGGIETLQRDFLCEACWYLGIKTDQIPERVGDGDGIAIAIDIFWRRVDEMNAARPINPCREIETERYEFAKEKMIDWGTVKYGYKYVTKDRDGSVYAWNEKPDNTCAHDEWTIADGIPLSEVSLTKLDSPNFTSKAAFAAYLAMPWEDSLIEKP